MTNLSLLLQDKTESLNVMRGQYALNRDNMTLNREIRKITLDIILIEDAINEDFKALEEALLCL